jgi:site-specific DNA-methyltransferase (adenine-specific)
MARLGYSTQTSIEPIVVARKPFTGTVAANVLEHGTGALNIDGTRIGTEVLPAQKAGQSRIGTFERDNMVTPERTGRWPANVTLDEYAADQLEASRFFYIAKAPKSERPNVDGVARPTVKPLTLMRWLVRLVTPPNGTVLESVCRFRDNGRGRAARGF